MAKRKSITVFFVAVPSNTPGVGVHEDFAAGAIAIAFPGITGLVKDSETAIPIFLKHGNSKGFASSFRPAVP
ncbi:hypothetical protein BX666DRAFT_2025273 [Dichotomocladium elegans]|nr:hypothetical protein BX666DRAFT_2025273 [Dichotomocladium elegans]